MSGNVGIYSFTCGNILLILGLLWLSGVLAAQGERYLGARLLREFANVPEVHLPRLVFLAGCHMVKTPFPCVN